MGLGWLIYEGRGPSSLGSRGVYPASPPTLSLENRGDAVAWGAASAGSGTNNRAEYKAVIRGMEHALGMGVRRLVVVGDSMLVVRQVGGQWKCRARELRRLHEQARGLVKCFSGITIRHLGRERNAHADELAAEKPAVPHIWTHPRYVATPPEGRLMADKQAAQLRWLWEARGVDSGALGRIFGVPASDAWHIGTGSRYNHLRENHL